MVSLVHDVQSFDTGITTMILCWRVLDYLLGSVGCVFCCWLLKAVDGFTPQLYAVNISTSVLATLLEAVRLVGQKKRRHKNVNSFAHPGRRGEI